MMTRSLVLLAVLGPAALAAQAPAVTGTVSYSLRRTPLAGAMVQLVGTGDASDGKRFGAVADSAGRFRIDSVTPGRYAATFFHPLLDSLGLEVSPRAMVVGAGAREAGELHLSTPSPATVLTTLCGPRAAGDSSGLVFGSVRLAADESPVAGATVTVSWSETLLEAKGARREERGVAARSSETGWFAICNVPTDAALLARATRAAPAGTSGSAESDVEPSGIRHLVLYVGGSGSAGTARASGVVRDERGAPVAGARVLLVGAEREAVTSEQGAWTLDSLPAGTQTFEARALGYTPVRTATRLADGQSSTVDLALGAKTPVLSTVEVKDAPRRKPMLAGFDERLRDNERLRRGHFITQEEIDRRGPSQITDMVAMIPSVNVRTARRRGDEVITGRRGCAMTVYLDGVRVIGKLGRETDAINRLIGPSQVAGIEVYATAMDAPPQYQPLNGLCGVVLIWTR